MQNGTSRYEKLRGYLEKAVEAKRNPEPVDQILFFSGNGFIFESMVAASTRKRRCSNIFRGSNGSATASATSTTWRDAHINRG